MCPHGFGYRCDECRAEDKRIERDMVKSGKFGYGVFIWQGDGAYEVRRGVGGLYGLVGHVELFKRKSSAEKLCEKLSKSSPKSDLVVRLVKNV